jgi:ribosome-associated protein
LVVERALSEAGEALTTRDRLIKLLTLICEKRGEHTTFLDMRNFSLGTDYFVITEGGSSKHLRAIAENIVSGFPSRLLHREGQGSPNWTVLDYGEIMVHIFAPEARRFYDLEGLWGDTVVSVEETEVPSI